MKSNRVLLFTLTVLLLAPATSLHAQWRGTPTGSTPNTAANAPLPYESDILTARPVRVLLGIGPGAMYYSHGGEFSPSCDCRFGGVDDLIFHIGGELLIQYPKLGIAYGLHVSFYDVSSEFSREETRASVVVGDNPDVLVDYRNTSDVALRWLSFTPEFLWYLPRSGFFFHTGLEIGIMQEATYNHVEHILTDGVTYYDGETVNTLLEEQDIPGGDRLRLALAGGIGYEFVVAPYVSITPRLGVNIPLTSVSQDDDSWRVFTATGLIMLHLRL